MFGSMLNDLSIRVLSFRSLRCWDSSNTTNEGVQKWKAIPSLFLIRRYYSANNSAVRSRNLDMEESGLAEEKEKTFGARAVQ